MKRGKYQKRKRLFNKFRVQMNSEIETEWNGKCYGCFNWIHVLKWIVGKTNAITLHRRFVCPKCTLLVRFSSSFARPSGINLDSPGFVSYLSIEENLVTLAIAIVLFLESQSNRVFLINYLFLLIFLTIKLIKVSLHRI